MYVHKDAFMYIISLGAFVVPSPSVIVTAPNTQTVGQPLTLTCNATTVRGITSTVDIMWSRSGSNLQTMSNISSTTVGSSVSYTDSYTIPSLSVDDDEMEYECILVVHTSPDIRVSDAVTIDATGMVFVAFVIVNVLLCLANYFLHILHAYCNFTVPDVLVTISPSGPIQGAMVGSPQMIQCTVSTVSGVESSSVMISWMGPGGDPITSDSRVIINPTTSDGNTYTSSIQFTYLMEGDEGTYMCNVMILETSGSASVVLETLTSKP